MSPVVKALRKMTPTACRHWIVLLYIAAVVSITLALAIREALS
jgi:hypothetical protein